ncbi:carboxylesterase/lipase family protein [Pseudohongiella sp.]|uniref:Carboxylesterase type B domain-containing protein n=1 Tax=marine sediment metagenome TaxID=412755 RepID=A0A0F9VY88_9ZZZZ|nr:carboxylesterase family protein [Pseudohongiella sp.]HDZ07965.1 carboxylesterase [Pseudohongiella sp.]HEA64428.1 carboxylesterase [Pseudohongiella sp.]
MSRSLVASLRRSLLRLKYRQFMAAWLLSGLGATVLACSPDGAESPSSPSESAAPAAAQADPTLRNLSQGQLTGVVQDNGSLAWQGIPFAQPPVGELRWKLPQPPAPWSGTLAATDPIQPCPQFVSGLSAGIADPDGDGIVGSEDCLYLSVYAPDNIPEGESLPVMYWIFGGGNNSGYAGDYNGGKLAQSQDVIVVTVNYRLGSLGWFYHPAILAADASGAAASGNWSTVDTIAGLQWVQNNIAAFGGDADNVTIFGESAGGGNVMSLVTSPMAEGLFHRAIVQSGGIGTTSVAQAVNYRDDDVPGHAHSSKEIINMILQRDGLAADRASAMALQESMSDDAIRDLLYSQDAAAFLQLYNPEAARNYPAPKKFTDGTVFVEQDPLAQLASGDYNQVPIILGTNRDERRIYLYAAMTDVIRNDPQEYIRFAHYPSVQWKWRGVDNLARRMAPAQDAPVYAYRFDWDEQRTSDNGLDMAVAIGAAHSTEMAFIFGDWDVGFISGDALYYPATNPGRDQLSAAMMSYWTNFAYTGATGTGRDGALPLWQPWRNGEGNPKTLILDSSADRGIRMMNDEVTLDSIKTDFMAEQWSAPQNRCRAYLATFGGTSAFDRDEYNGLAEGGCGDL